MKPRCITPVAVLVLALVAAGCDVTGTPVETEAPPRIRAGEAAPSAVADPSNASERPRADPPTAGNPLAWVGEKHNEGLHYILSGIPAEVKRRGSRYEYYQAALGRCVSYMAREGLAVSSCDRLKWPDDATAARAGRRGWSFASRESGAALRPRSPRLAFVIQSTQLDRYLAEIEYVSETYGTRAELASSLASIEAAANAVLPPEEMEALFAVSSVAYSSAVYWEENSDEWLAGSGIEDVLLIDRRVPLFSGRSAGLALVYVPFDVREAALARWSHRRVVRSDVSGAIAGAIGGLLMGGQVLNGAIAGSITFSAAEAVEQLLELI